METTTTASVDRTFLPSGSEEDTPDQEQHSSEHGDRAEHERNRQDSPSAGPIDEPNEKNQSSQQQGSASQQPHSQEAHADPSYMPLNPWYRQPPAGGPTFSLGWPLPRTVRSGMLNNLTPDVLEALNLIDRKGLLDYGDEEERAGADDSTQVKDFEKSSAHSIRHDHSPTEDRPLDVRHTENRPATRVMPEEKKEGSPPPDAREEDNRPTTHIMTHERKDQEDEEVRRTRTARSRQWSGDRAGTSLESSDTAGTLAKLREQASEPGHTPAGIQRAPTADELRNRWSKLRAKAPEPLAEFAATTVAIYLGLACGMSFTMTEGAYGTFGTQCFGWGFASMFGIYLAGGISGAHLNPAISITLALFRVFPWRRCAIYICAQLLGGIVAAALIFSSWHDVIYHFDPSLTPSKSGKALFTIPQPFISISTAFFNEFVAGVVLMMVVLALGDDTNAPPGAGMNAFILGLLVTTLMFAFSYQTGLALNPARDFGPRLIAMFMGYPTTIFTGYSWWWLWGAWVAPLCGCITGCVCYDTFVFTGGESPLNYRWPTKREFLQSLRNKQRRAHDHVKAHAKVRHS